MERTIEQLREMQSWSLEQKIKTTQTRILEWYNHWDGQVYVSFSGGKDSTVLLDLCRRMFHDIEAVYSDTGLEYPEIKQFVKSFDNVTIVRPKMSFRDVLQTYGYPVASKEIAHKLAGMQRGAEWSKKYYDETDEKYDRNSRYRISDKWLKFAKENPEVKISENCCNVMKKSPLHIYDRKSKKKAIIGMLAEESMMRTRKWLENGCNAFSGTALNSNPMSFWTEQDVLEYIKRFNIPICSVYGDIIEVDGKLKCSGTDRTGCVFCMFGVHLEKQPNRFQKLKVSHPQLWDYCMKPFDEGGLGMKPILESMSVPIE